jgi:KaiC/GvpD/RAD55 family RecA-like ATPase
VEKDWYDALQEGRKAVQAISRLAGNKDAEDIPRDPGEYMKRMMEDPFSVCVTSETRTLEKEAVLDVMDQEGNLQRVANAGDLVAIIGIPGSGKTSAAISATACSINPDREDDDWGWSFNGEKEGATLLFDTEQPNYAVKDRIGEIKELAGDIPYIWTVKGVGPSNRLRSLYRAVVAAAERHDGKIRMIVVDGITDLAPSINDELMAKELVDFLGIIADELQCTLLGIIHQNRQGTDPSPRGHIGQEFQRKAASIMGVKNDPGDTSQSVKTLCSPVGKMRNGVLPEKKGPKVKYSVEANRFVAVRGEALAALDQSFGDAWGRVRNLFLKAPGSKFDQSHARDAYRTLHGMTESSARKRVSQDFTRLKDDGLLDGESKRGGKWWLTDKGTDKLNRELDSVPENKEG